MAIYIQAGQFKGRKLKTIKGIRLVEGRIKKVLHSVLQSVVSDNLVLDLFGGMGSLGIETLSWGAEHVFFVEKNRAHTEVLKTNITSLQLGKRCSVYQEDAFDICTRFAEQKQKFDLVLLDPPYHSPLMTKALNILKGYDIVSVSGLVVCLAWAKQTFDREGFVPVFDRRYGDRVVVIGTL